MHWFVAWRVRSLSTPLAFDARVTTGLERYRFGLSGLINIPFKPSCPKSDRCRFLTLNCSS